MIQLLREKCPDLWRSHYISLSSQVKIRNSMWVCVWVCLYLHLYCSPMHAHMYVSQVNCVEKQFKVNPLRFSFFFVISTSLQMFLFNIVKVSKTEVSTCSPWEPVAWTSSYSKHPLWYSFFQFLSLFEAPPTCCSFGCKGQPIRRRHLSQNSLFQTVDELRGRTKLQYKKIGVILNSW